MVRMMSAMQWLRVVVSMLMIGGLARAQPNILLIIADDLGVDRVGAYAEHPDPGHTPVLDQLAAEGVLFRHAYSNPVCSSTRATLLTGRYSFRTGIGHTIHYVDTVELPISETTIPQILSPAYRTAAVGKWHLSASGVSDLLHPMLVGFEHHYGSISNLAGLLGNGTYFDWEKNVDGTLTQSTTYATTDTVNDALMFISQFSAPPNPEPWFLWVAFDAPHKPYHKPPPELHSFVLPDEINDNPLFMKALTEAMDTEIGRLLSSMDPQVRANTVVIFVGDNGTDPTATTAPFVPGHAKSTPYEGGINVPLIISGPRIDAGAECTALVNTTDIIATVAEIAGALSTAEDSVSLVPYFTAPGLPSLRNWVFAERFKPNGFGPFEFVQRAVRMETFKIIQSYNSAGTLTKEELFDLGVDAFEQVNLLNGTLTAEQQLAYGDLLDVLDGLFPFVPPDPWVDLGSSLAGTNGHAVLLGDGTLLPDDPVNLFLSNGLENALAGLVIGLSSSDVPFQGGTLVPSPDWIVLLFTNGSGGLVTSGSWPRDLSGIPIYFQYWIVDPGGKFGYAASNALRATAP